MVKPICKDIFFLGRMCKTADKSDCSIADDLVDTLKANSETCVGMAANMIGSDKRIIAVNDRGRIIVMFNPEIVSCSGAYATEEGCLSLSGKRPATRYKCITVKYQDRTFKTLKSVYLDWTAQIIQHEIDHCNGKVI